MGLRYRPYGRVKSVSSSLAREGRGGFYTKNRYNNLTIINQQIRNYEENDE